MAAVMEPLMNSTGVLVLRGVVLADQRVQHLHVASSADVAAWAGGGAALHVRAVVMVRAADHVMHHRPGCYLRYYST